MRKIKWGTMHSLHSILNGSYFILIACINQVGRLLVTRVMNDNRDIKEKVNYFECQVLFSRNSKFAYF